MEESSRCWMIHCPHCNFDRSVWDWGGIRRKASGNLRQNLARPNCKQLGWQTIYRKETRIYCHPPGLMVTTSDTGKPRITARRWPSGDQVKS